jgi:CheY-like chemotaxis protein/anti-sigma regulatory factor (Ser/Thr protein kinase)
MSRILVVEDSKTQALQIRRMLELEGYHVDGAGNGVAALRSIETSKPDLILTDLVMPEMDGLQLVETVRRAFPAIPVILMTAVGNEEIAVEALKKGAATYIPKRNLLRDLYSSLETVLSISQSQRYERRMLDCLTTSEYQFVLGNEHALITPLVWFLEERLAQIHHSDRNEWIRMGIALHEAVVNAIEHGNLELRSEMRQDDDEKAYRDLLRVRQQESPYRERRVQVTAKLSQHETIYTVTDQGSGFDSSRLHDPMSADQLERIGGRGLRLIRMFMDRVDYNARGNSVMMVKVHSRRKSNLSESA